MTTDLGLVGEQQGLESRGRVRVTERDKLMLGWLGQVRVATVAQLQRRFGLHRRVAYRRVRKLHAIGAVEVSGMPGLAVKVVSTTALGMRIAEVALPVAAGGPGLRDVFHALDLTDLTIDYELELAGSGAVVLTEREIQADATSRQAPGWRVSYRSGGQQRWHLPDLVYIQPGARVAQAVEFEASVKAAARLRAIVRAYAEADTFAGVTYVCLPRVIRAVEAARQRSGPGALAQVTIAPWVPVDRRDGRSLFDAQDALAGSEVTR